MRIILATLLCLSISGFCEYVPKDYGHLIQKMPKIDASLLDTHFTLYRGYVAAVNQLDDLLKNENNKSFTYQSIKRRFGWEYDGMRLHELYFDNLGGNGKVDSNSLLFKELARQFGSFDGWLADFRATANTRGIGWVILSYNKETNTLRNVWVGEHDTGLLVTETPLLVVDLWEHAYLCQFKLNRAQYLDIIFEYVNWGVVVSRYVK